MSRIVVCPGLDQQDGVIFGNFTPLHFFMPTTPQLPTKRGRPKKSPVDSLRVRVWFEAVRLVSGLPSAYAIEKTLHPESFHREAGWVSRPQRWDRYETGNMVPKSELVAYAESVYPGTADWLYHPLWKALLPHARTQDGLNAELRTLGEEVCALLFRSSLQPGRPDRLPFTEETAGMLSHLGSLEALAAAILLVHESAAIASEPLRALALHAYRTMQPAIAAYPPLRRMYPDLFSYIDVQYPEWVFPSANHRLRTVVFWEGYRDSCWPEDEARKSRELCEAQDAKKKPSAEQQAWQEHFEKLRSRSAEDS